MGLISFLILLLLWQWAAQGYTSVILPSAIAVIMVGSAHPTTYFYKKRDRVQLFSAVQC